MRCSIRAAITHLNKPDKRKGGLSRPIFCLASRRTSDLEINGRLSASFCLNFIADLLAFIEALQPGTFDRTDMNEHVLAAAVGLNKTKPLCGVEPLNRS